MTWRPPGTLGVLRLLAKNSLLRLLRAARIHRQRRDAVAGRSRRRATQRKRGDGLMWLLVLMMPLFLFQAILMSGRAVGNLQVAARMAAPVSEVMVVPDSLYWELIRNRECDEAALLDMLDRTGVDEHHRPARSQVLEHWRSFGPEGFLGERTASRTDFLVEPAAGSSPESRAILLGAGTVLLLGLLGMLVAIAFGGANATLAGGSWTEAWLLTFPVATRSLVLAKALEYSLVTFFPWLTLCPLLWQLLRAQGQSGALFIAIGATLVTTFLVGALRLWLETRLRLTASLRTLRSVQGCGALGALLMMALVFSVCLGESTPDWFVTLAQAVPAAAALLPGAWPLALGSHGLLAPLVGVGATVAAFAFAVTATARLLRHGTMRSGGVDAGARGHAGGWRRLRRLGVVGKDLALLLRDRNFLIQTVVVPIFVIGLQLVVNPGLGRVEGSGVAMLAYGIGLYTLIGGCFQVLSAEGRALWLLYSLPVSIAATLRQKTRIWATIAIGFAEVALLAFVLRGGASTDVGAIALDALFVAFGVWCAAHIAAGISVLGCNPAADHVPRQPKARHVYLYFFFASTFIVGLGSTDLAPRVAAGLVFATLAYAVWQRACDRLPWLLDPVDEPRATVGLYDGAAALMVFFVLQALLTLLFISLDLVRGDAITALLLAFVLAGTVTVPLFLALLAGRGVDVRTSLGLRSPGRAQALWALALAGLAGAGLGQLGLAYQQLIARYEWFALPATPADGGFALLLLAVLAAPLVEEVLFRGLVFGGLVRSVRPPVAVLWSAMLFAAVHPVHSWPPVFLLGLLAAFLQWKTRFLPAAMLLHAVYNLVVVGLAGT